MPDYASRVLRLQMNRLPSGARVHPHADRGYYSTNAHRYHIPVIASRCVRFEHESGNGVGNGSGDASARRAASSSSSSSSTPQALGRQLKLRGRGCIMSHACTTGKAYRATVRRLEDASSWDEIPFKEGEAFEVNNVIKHRVEQTGPWERVTLIIDLLDQQVDRTLEINSGCRSWFEAACYRSANVTESEWRGERHEVAAAEVAHDD